MSPLPRRTLKQQLRKIREELIATALRQTDGNVTDAAALLGIWRSRLHEIIRTSSRLKRLTTQHRQVKKKGQ